MHKLSDYYYAHRNRKEHSVYQYQCLSSVAVSIPATDKRPHTASKRDHFDLPESSAPDSTNMDSAQRLGVPPVKRHYLRGSCSCGRRRRPNTSLSWRHRERRGDRRQQSSSSSSMQPRPPNARRHRQSETSSVVQRIQ